MPRGDGTGPRGMGAGTGRGLGGCKVRGAGAARESGASKDRGAGFLQRITASGSGSEGRLTGRSKGIGMAVLDVLFSFFERASRK
ncbi:MAG: DUF5320 family protein [Deltaproteobacteria bacterium]|nr:DUF5320 family protein [Deltaproteobacteria bacterium]